MNIAEVIQMQLEVAILQDKWESGDKICSMSDMTQIYSCSLSTAKKVLGLLEKQNIVYFRVGKGYYIKPFAKEKLKVKYEEKIKKQIEEVIGLAKICNMMEIVRDSIRL